MAPKDQFFIKTGVGSPENFLGYREFYYSDKARLDGTTPVPWYQGELHRYNLVPVGGMAFNVPNHTVDWLSGDPTWDTQYYVRPPNNSSRSLASPISLAGKGIIGALRYLAARHVNSIYALTLNLGGAGRDVHPFYDPPLADIGGDSPTVPAEASLHYSIKRMQEWDTVLSFAMKQGIMADLVLWDNSHLTLDWLGFTPEEAIDYFDRHLTWARRLYLKQMVAYFGHLNGLKWIVSEETRVPPASTGGNPYTYTYANMASIEAWMSRWDAYHDHCITFHTWGNTDAVYEGLLMQQGNSPWLRSTSLQWYATENQTRGGTGWFPLPPASPQ